MNLEINPVERSDRWRERSRSMNSGNEFLSRSIRRNAMTWFGPIWVGSMLVVALLGGCAHVQVDSVSPLSKAAAKARTVFQSKAQSKAQSEKQTDTAAAGHNFDELHSATSVSPANLASNGLSSNALSSPSPGEVQYPVARFTIGDQKSAYEQGRFDAMQAAYQQPTDRIYTNPQPQQLFPPQYQAQPGFQSGQRPIAVDQYGRPLFEAPTHPYQPQPTHELAYPGQYDRSPDLNGPAEFANQSAAISQQGSVQPGQYDQIPSEDLRSTPLSVGQPNNPVRESPISEGGHLANGMNFDGTELRHEVKTATDIALDLRDEIASLRNQLKTTNAKVEQLTKTLQARESTLNSTNDLLTKSNRQAVLLREKIASQHIKIQDLEIEKVAIETNADKALKEIEANLDAMLLNSISKNR